MSAQRPSGNTRLACSRCRDHKRRCDKAVPRCSLCKRLGQVCKYENPASASASPYSGPSASLGFENAFAPHGIKDCIVQKLADFRPQDIVSIYSRTLHSWFAFTSEVRLCAQLPNTWGDASVDFALFAFTILLFNADLQLVEGHYSLQSDTMLMYLSIKSSIALLEGAGLNSIDLVYSRLLITLFEVMHGFHPAAYLSIAATVRAADALSVYEGKGVPLGRVSDSIKEREERREMWCGILILDSGLLLAFENGSKASLDDEAGHCRAPSIAALGTLIDGILKLLDELGGGIIDDVQIPSPFILHLLYKAAAIVTERVQIHLDPEINLQKLRTLRKTLKLMGQRWLAGGKQIDQDHIITWLTPHRTLFKNAE
ncbi:hypothetical protein BKA61DRAFT_476355 [Leptodontidium sp. MPI-SDFR-AT-0119]|nr:hypothetical protein BKA61DRAFT_476355 [Leptodontidium sp. MPI-SDFR-AT-0119]